MNGLDLSGRHALVTGGGSGVGAEIARSLAACGASVTIVGRRREVLDEVASSSDGIFGVEGDVADEASLASAFARAAAERGAPAIAIANAGAADSVPFHKMDLAGWQKMMAVNLTGVFLTFRNALPAMREAGFGRMIAIASTAGVKGYPYVAHYCAAKHGVIGLTRALALETAKTGVTVNAVCPGFTETPLLQRSIDNIVEKTGKSREEAAAALTVNNPMGRFIQPREIAETVKWLVSADAGSVTGQAISISGGEI